jgi:hypothetical protein
MSPCPERYRLRVTRASVTSGESANDLVNSSLPADADLTDEINGYVSSAI